MDNADKPKLSVQEQLVHLAAKGVRFTVVSRDEALAYLRDNNNYFKLTAYRKNFPKHPAGPLAGQYIDLEFAQLRDLAVIDMRLRYLLLHMALDIEHYAKVKIIKLVEDASEEDGYTIVAEFMDSLPIEQQADLARELNRDKSSHYCGSIVKKHEGKFPIWAFVEIIPFGRLLHLCRFSATRFSSDSLMDEYYLLMNVKDLRNAAAHNNCLLNDLAPGSSVHRTRLAVRKALGDAGFSRSSADRKMSCVRMQQIITLLFTHKLLVTSAGVRHHRTLELHGFLNRMRRHQEWYVANDQVTSSFRFLEKIIDSWFPEA